MWGALKDSQTAPGEVYATLLEMDRVLGLGVAGMQEDKLQVPEEDIRRLIDERNAARKAKNFARADEIRKELAAKGITLEDSAKGTIWRKG
jgi:cysteinyl-tRNA synthetase